MSVRWDVDRSKLDAEFASDVDTLLADSEYAWAVTYGFRTRDEQAALYEKHLAGGPLAAPPGRSAHEYGLAVDVARVTDAGALSWDTAHDAWPWLWAACLAHPRLHSGHAFGDDDHIQAVKWQAKKAELKAEGCW